MAILTEDVAEAVKVLWNANATLTARITALIFGRVPESGNPLNSTIASPYTSYALKDGNVTRTAGTAYMQAFTIEFTTWDETGAADEESIKLLIEQTFGPLDGNGNGIAPGTAVALPSGRTLRILYSLKRPGGLEEDPATKAGQAVKLSKDVFELLCQG